MHNNNNYQQMMRRKAREETLLREIYPDDESKPSIAQAMSDILFGKAKDNGNNN